MPDERDFTYEFAEGVRLRARFLHDRGIIIQFLVQLEKRLDNSWRPVLRYDNAHGQPHIDTLDRIGREISKHWLYKTNDDVLTAAIEDIKLNWPEYIERFMKDERR